MFHLHVVREMILHFMGMVLELVVTRRGHFGRVDRHGGPDFRLRLSDFVVEHLEEDGARLDRLQFRVETPLDDGVAAFQQGDAQLDRFHENVGR